MTVKQLIEQLQMVDGNLEVLTSNAISYQFHNKVYVGRVDGDNCAIIDLVMED